VSEGKPTELRERHPVAQVVHHMLLVSPMGAYLVQWAASRKCLDEKWPYIAFRLGWHPNQLPHAKKGPYLDLARPCACMRFFCQRRALANAAPKAIQAHPDDAPQPDPATRRPDIGGSRMAACHFRNKKGTGLCQIVYFGFRVPADFAINSPKNDESWGLHRLMCSQTFSRCLKIPEQSMVLPGSADLRKNLFHKSSPKSQL